MPPTRNNEKNPTYLLADDPPKEQPRKEIAPAQKLLNFLQRWNGDSVTLRDLRVWGPRSLRDRKKAISTAETLVEYGWLTPTKPHWPGTYAWQILRKNIVNPPVAM
jgi:hypothetical protein